MCQKWAAGPYMAISCSDVVFESEAALGVYKSSEWGERGFCKTCGTSLFWRMTGYCGVSEGAFDALGPISFTTEVFIDEKPTHYEFANKTTQMTGAEVFALFMQDGSE
ncbi:MAG: aldehyde-activating protein [Robiginitomaculum sp.]|nr:MAG: aldehyde-activating protein [Robiginitomaculum sp.]